MRSGKGQSTSMARGPRIRPSSSTVGCQWPICLGQRGRSSSQKQAVLGCFAGGLSVPNVMVRSRCFELNWSLRRQSSRVGKSTSFGIRTHLGLNWSSIQHLPVVWRWENTSSLLRCGFFTYKSRGNAYLVGLLECHKWYNAYNDPIKIRGTCKCSTNGSNAADEARAAPLWCILEPKSGL